MSAPAAAAVPPRPWRRLAAIVLIFLLIGPAIGAIALVGGTELMQVRKLDDLPRVTRFFANHPGLIFGMGYVIGGLPAIFAGVAVGIRHVFFGGAGWLWALTTGLVSGLGFIAYLYVAAGPNKRSDMNLLSWKPIPIVLTCIVPTLACWALARVLVRSPPAPMVP